MCICVPNIKFLCITCARGKCAQMMPMPMLMQDKDANDDDGQSMIVQGSLVDKLNEPKKNIFIAILTNGICVYFSCFAMVQMSSQVQMCFICILIFYCIYYCPYIFTKQYCSGYIKHI